MTSLRKYVIFGKIKFWLRKLFFVSWFNQTILVPKRLFQAFIKYRQPNFKHKGLLKLLFKTSISVRQYVRAYVFERFPMRSRILCAVCRGLLYWWIDRRNFVNNIILHNISYLELVKLNEMLWKISISLGLRKSKSVKRYIDMGNSLFSLSEEV